MTTLTLPPLGNLAAYIAATIRMPMLTLEEEQLAARRVRDAGDLQAEGQLIKAHLRLVVKMARQYLGYGLPHEDLIQEGNVGLMKAVKRFDPDIGVRLSSYAIIWIKAEIHEYIVKNWRMVKVATTKAQRKLFYNLRSRKQDFRSEVEDGDTHRCVLSDDEANIIASELSVTLGDVREMETRMSGGDVSIDPPSNDDETPSFGPIAFLSNTDDEPPEVLQKLQHYEMSSVGIAEALNELDDRSKRIVTERWLNVNDQGTGKMSLHELALEYNVSGERIRQIEAQALKKIRLFLSKKYSL